MRIIDVDELVICATCGEHHTAEDVIMMIKTAPTVDAAPVRHGRWIYHPDDLFPGDSTQECSCCHEEEYLTLCNGNYCPNCGAKMDLHDECEQEVER